MSDIRLTGDDPIIAAKCPRCDKHGNGKKVGTYYGKSFNERQWRRGQTCENCGSALVEIRRINIEA
jgi:hypothetical protein